MTAADFLAKLPPAMPVTLHDDGRSFLAIPIWIRGSLGMVMSVETIDGVDYLTESGTSDCAFIHGDQTQPDATWFEEYVRRVCRYNEVERLPRHGLCRRLTDDAAADFFALSTAIIELCAVQVMTAVKADTGATP